MITLHDLHSILVRISFPSSKEEILQQVKDLGEPAAVTERLQLLPDGYYGSVNMVIDTLRELA